MGRTRIIVLIVAAVCAIGLALIVGSMLKHNNRVAVTPAPIIQAPDKPMARVLVAHQDLQIGHRLAAGDLAWQDWPVDAVNTAFITDGQGAHVPPRAGAQAVAQEAGEAAKTAAAVVSGAQSPMDALYGSIVREPILNNEPITNTKLVRGGEGNYMAVVLKPGMRAVAVMVSNALAAGGFILPGDHVDVIQSRPSSTPGASGGASNTYVAQTLLRNVRVLAIDQTAQPPKNGQSTLPAPTTATLEVRPSDAEVLARAKSQGEIVLALRSYADANGPSGRGAQAVDNEGQVKIFRPGQTPEVVVLQ
ncbi:MAG TPA: Flp pilus assembly protein CpaB [Caulobacteraceae bacterium]|nr:Flp pilus assembly protein CpaB [Caulobacteraceae bacterium]